MGRQGLDTTTGVTGGQNYGQVRRAHLCLAGQIEAVHGAVKPNIGPWKALDG
jgi:hypothetical protein